jgi:hypothetical protein
MIEVFAWSRTAPDAPQFDEGFHPPSATGISTVYVRSCYRLVATTNFSKYQFPGQAGANPLADFRPSESG